MLRFKIGDKVYSKQGKIGLEIGTVKDLNGEVVVVRLFSDPAKVSGTEFNEAELLTETEHKNLIAQEQERQRRQNDEMQDKWRLGN